MGLFHCVAGQVTRGLPKILLVSFCEHGSLVNVLRTHFNGTKDFNTRERLQMMLDVAKVRTFDRGFGINGYTGIGVWHHGGIGRKVFGVRGYRVIGVW